MLIAGASLRVPRVVVGRMPPGTTIDWHSVRALYVLGAWEDLGAAARDRPPHPGA